MYEVVTITKVLSKKRVEVVCSSSACSGCKGSTFCNTKGKKFEVSNTNNLELKSGEEVSIFLKPSRTIISTLITLIAPLLLFPVGYYLAKAISLTEGASFLLGLCGILLGFVFVWLYFKKTESQYLPVVESVIEEED